MSNLTSLDELLAEGIKDLYSAENQLVKALPKMAAAATHPELVAAFEEHLEETVAHVERLQEVAELLGVDPGGKTCKAMRGLVEEGAETIETTGEPLIIDLALITAAQKVEHYEISGYGSARALAEVLGLTEVVDILQTTLDEEATTDDNLTVLAETIVGELMAVPES